MISIENSQTFDVSGEFFRCVKTETLIFCWIVGNVEVEMGGSVDVLGQVFWILQLVHSNSELVVVLGFVLSNVGFWLERPGAIEDADILKLRRVSYTRSFKANEKEGNSLRSFAPPTWVRRSFRQPWLFFFELVENRWLGNDELIDSSKIPTIYASLISLTRSQRSSKRGLSR
ncbi:hypothetical protein GCK72_001891 [Caenorhabditis remanei]|uniref:Uncharacterized protein n=1 Tax=Caenorhabditis remanei TaxID=31234 RepID=A0A6A5HUZ8_CAERE|nr:hypothetical protein GCK72_001891 [Caenorhabditis remanei]KAF1770073.1 hypothetical protein GCK72_001891 [Caenorhabditis remanei]